MLYSVARRTSSLAFLVRTEFDYGEVLPELHEGFLMFLCQCRCDLLDCSQVLQILFIGTACSLVACCRFLADENLRASDSQSVMGTVASIAVDDAMQMLPTLLGHRESRFGLRWVGQKR